MKRRGEDLDRELDAWKIARAEDDYYARADAEAARFDGREGAEPFESEAERVEREWQEAR